MASHLSILQGGAGAPPPFTCRKCHRTAVRYIGGKRRSFYCGEHGPSKLSDWTRLIPIPIEEYESAGRVMVLAPPLPPRIARLIEGLADSLRDVLYQDFPAASVPDMAAVQQLEAENARLKQEVEHLTADLAAANEIATEAMSLWPSPDAALAEADLHQPVEDRHTERDFPPPDTEPRPRAPGEPPTFPAPEEAPEAPVKPPGKAPSRPVQPRSPGKGYKVTAPAPAAESAPAAEQAPAGRAIPNWTDADLNLFGLDVLTQHIALDPKAPGLTATRRALKDFKDLTTMGKRAVLDALNMLASDHPEMVREEHIFGMVEQLVALRASGKLRIICLKEGRNYHIHTITHRRDKRFFRNER